MAKIEDIKKMKELITELYCVTNTAHVAHINTRSFAQHKALGEFYDFTSDFKDRMIEYIVGQGYVGQISTNPIDTDEDIMDEATEAMEMINEFSAKSSDETLKNMAADFQEAVGKLKYLLMLK
jgi:hypothetical protein